MHSFKIAASSSLVDLLKQKGREVVDINNTDFIDICAVVVEDSNDKNLKRLEETTLKIPKFIICNPNDIDFKKIEEEANKYEEENIPPFFKKLKNYSEHDNLQFDTPGHHRVGYFGKHPAGKALVEFYGENVFNADLSSSDVDLGDLLIHEGPALAAQKHAAKVFNADKTYFVMNGTSASNTVASTAVLAPGDLVLFDRNNHKSAYHSALVAAGGLPIYLETSRNPFGFIGGIYEHCFDEKYIRDLIAKKYPHKANEKRPIRLAVIQLGTYDGTIYNARQVVDKIGHLCDYILFDSAWVGYEQFIPMMRDCSPLLLELNENDPGILVTQSVHKQQAGFSQASQIHKKDSHIKGQKRYVNHKRFNNAFMMYASTSPFYAIFASLDVNAKMQDGEYGKKLWADCLEVSINARKDVFKRCKLLTPFVPDTVNSKKWYEYDTKEIASNIEFFKFIPGAKWHSFEGYGENQYFVDPNKFMLTTPGINTQTGEYEEFGIPATILANYLRENNIIPEKNDLNSILFLMTPAETAEKMKILVDHFVKFEELVNKDVHLKDILPSVYEAHKSRYKDYTIKRLCQEMHDFYKKNNTKLYQKRLFLHDYLPEPAMSPKEAYQEFLKNNAKLVPLDNIVGEVALEGALPYPPGVFCVVPGEKWNEVVQKYFLILQDGINEFPGFAPEIQGVYFEPDGDKVKAYGYVRG